MKLADANHFVKLLVEENKRTRKGPMEKNESPKKIGLDPLEGGEP